MKSSEISAETLRGYLRLDDNDPDVPLEALLAAARRYVTGYTGIDEAELDGHEDISIAILVLCSDFYDNRQMTVESDKVNRVVQSILDLHCVNLL